MPEITASLVKELRKKTDAPMMECKKALIEACGDLSRAEELIRISFGKKASQVSNRISKDGLIGLYISKTSGQGALVEINSETDFVAKNKDFKYFVDKISELVAKENPSNISDLLALTWQGQTIKSWLESLIGKIGENISISRFSRFETNSNLSGYLHNGKIGVIVEFEGSETVGKDLAMHIAALKPVALKKDEIDPLTVSRERSLVMQKVAQSGKTGVLAEKIIEGSIQKFLSEITLMSQFFVKNPKQTIEAMLKEKNASIKKFLLYVVGEDTKKNTG